MNPLRKLMARHFSLTVLTLVSASELAVLQWARLALDLPLIPVLWLAGLLPAVGLANFVSISGLRRLGRGGIAGHALSRVFLVASMGAILSGAMLAGVAVPALLLEIVTGPGLGGGGLMVAGGGLAVGLGFGSILWGMVVGQRRVTVEDVPIPMPGLARAHEGLVIAHITDLHIGPHLSGLRLQGFVDRVNALDPDILVITGDIFDFDPQFIDGGCQILDGLRARRGVYACLGNHDVYTGAEEVARGIARHTSIRLLRDEWVRVDVPGAPLYLLGIDDPGRGWNEFHRESPALTRLCEEVPPVAGRVVLMHRPSYFNQVARLGLPLALAGHTHGGQVSLPPPAHNHNISRLLTEWTRGLFRQGGSLLYVNRGLGVAGLPVRLNCSREIALLRLTGEG